MTARRCGGQDERGATFAMTALLLIALVGMMALVIDIAMLHQERRELQNGADAAALAIAHDCASGNCGAYATTADTYVDGNASDGDATVAPGAVTFPSANSVRVRATTADAGPNSDGDVSTVDAVFSRIYGRTGQQVSATAVATWGPPASGATLPLAISSCEWEDATSDGTSYATGPPFTVPSLEYTVYLHDSGNGPGSPTPHCQFGPGQDIDGDGSRVEGGFGWLDATDCVATVDDNGFVAAEPGNAVPNSCTAADFMDKTILIPIFDDIPDSAANCPAGSPASKCYHVFGFAAFHVTGIRLSGGGSLVDNPPCSNPDRCLSGYFTQLIFDAPAVDVGGANLGVSIVGLTE